MTDVFDKPEQTSEGTTVADLVGEGKKFKTVEDLARGKVEADAFIERLKQENATALEAARNSALADEKLDVLRKEIATLKAANPQSSREPTSPALTPDSIKTLVSEAITQTERNRTAQQNINAANDQMVKTLGSLENAANAVKAKASEVGMTLEALKDIAAKSPSAFLKIMGQEVALSREPLDPTRVVRENTPNLTPNAPTAGTKAYFDNILKTQGRGVYFTPRIQQEIWKAVQAGTYQL